MRKRSAPTDERAVFESFVRSRTPALLRTAYLLTGDQHLAEDLVQTALIRTHRAWPRLRDTGNVESYTRRVMYHTQVSWWRGRRVRELLSTTPPEPRAGGSRDEGAEVEDRLTVRRALLALTPKQRAVLLLRYFEDRTEDETAHVLGISRGTVKSQTFKALARLREVAPELADMAAGGSR